MRTALDQALGAPGGGYAAGLAQGQPIKAIHIQELRDRVLAAWVSGGSTDIRWLVTDHLGIDAARATREWINENQNKARKVVPFLLVKFQISSDAV